MMSATQVNRACSISTLQFGDACLFLLWWIVLIIGTTTGIGLFTSWYDEHRVLSLALYAVLTIYLPLRREVSFGSKEMMFLLSMAALGLCASIQSMLPPVALVEAGIFLCALVGVFVFAHLFKQNAWLMEKGLPLAALAVAATQVSAILGNYVAALLMGDLTYYIWITGFSNPRFPAHIQALLLPFLPAAIDYLRKGWHKRCAWTVAAIWISSLIGLGSRGAWLAFAGGAIFVACARSPSAVRWFKQMCAIVAGGMLCFALLAYVVPAFLHIQPSGAVRASIRNITGLSSRDVLWQQALEMIASRPLFGWGPMHFAAFDGEIAAHAHNFWLQIGAEWGLPAACLVFFASAVMLKRLVGVLRNPSLASSPAQVGICAACAGWFTYALVDGVYVIPSTVMVTLPVIGAGWALANSLQMKTAQNIQWSGAVFKTIAIAALIPIVLVPFLGLGHRVDRESEYMATHPKLLAPRFWQQGFIFSEDAKWVGWSSAQ